MYESNNEAANLFKKAYIVDKQIVVANLSYLRDCHKGIGENDLPRYIFKDLVENYPEESNYKWVFLVQLIIK